ncbi:MAG: AI-2E family transporter [Candidatus Eremiobacteraeota bacterium]|nr:AI-2E family transporter [Candidatus Eremiobacteraeota bacterium]
MTAEERRPLVRSERRVTSALKVMLLIAVSFFVFSGILDFVGRIRSAAIVLIGAIFFTYVIYPLVRRLNTRLPLIWSIVAVYAGIALVVAFGVSVVLPALAADTRALIVAFPSIEHNAQSALVDPNNPLVARMPDWLRSYVATVPSQLARFAQEYAGQTASLALGLVLSAVTVVATLVVIPVLAAYLIIEMPALLEAFERAIPPRARPKSLAIVRDLDVVLGGFIRGQLLVGVTIGTCVTIMLVLTHVKYGVLIGVAAGVLDVIPYVGAVVAFIPATTIALFSQGWQQALLVAGLFIVIFQLEGHFIAPRIVSQSVGLSPLIVIVALLVGGELGGIGGMFLAVPVAAILRVLVQHALPYDRPVAPEAALVPSVPRTKRAKAKAS